jgi:BMFP domain-containing protein YqiC
MSQLTLGWFRGSTRPSTKATYEPMCLLRHAADSDPGKLLQHRLKAAHRTLQRLSRLVEISELLVEWLKPGVQSLDVVPESGDIRRQLVLRARQRLYRLEQRIKVPVAVAQPADALRERVQVIESAHDEARRNGEGVEHGSRV